MMYKLIIFIFSLTFAVNAFTQTINDSIRRYLPNTAYEIGEILKYEISFGIIKGGEAAMVIDLVQNGPQWVYHVTANAYTTGLINKMATIKDVYESYIDVESGFPIKSIRNIHESKYENYNEVLFDRKRAKVLSLKTGEHDVPNNLQDMLSAFYFCRRALFNNIGKTTDVMELNTWFDDELFTIKIKFKKYEQVKLNFGKINCMLFQPVIEKGSTFKKEDDFKIYITNDNNFIPVRIRAKLNYGSVKVDLIEYSGLKNAFNALEPKK